MLTTLVQVAFAGSVYVNGVNVDALRNQTFDNVKVTLDANGNILIDAPNYRIEVQGQGATSPPPTSTTTTPPATYTAAPGATTARPSAPATVTSASNPGTAGIGAGRWWLVTEDNGSRGHAIEVYVNNTLVTTVHSGDPQMILDLGPWMANGSNAIRMASNSQGASGGSLNVYVGTGHNDAGTVVMDAPAVQYGVGSTRTGAFSRDYNINVQ
jgi:hypothetical protein